MSALAENSSGVPDVSVIMTVWNTERYLAEAIESVRAQCGGVSWELIIVDDGSTDGSHRLAQMYVDLDPGRIRLLTHEGGMNCGISASRNRGIAEASADVLAFLDSDDVWLPHRLVHQFKVLTAHPEAVMIYGQAERWFAFEQPFCETPDCNSRNFIPPLVPDGATPGLLAPVTLLRWFLADESLTPCTCAVLVRAEAARRVGGFESSFEGLYDDQVFYAKLSLQERIIADPECIARYRRHEQSCCAKAVADGRQNAMRETFLQWLAAYERQHRDQCCR